MAIGKLFQIGKLPQGLNPPSWNMLRFQHSHLPLVIKTGLVTGIISLTVCALQHSLPAIIVSFSPSLKYIYIYIHTYIYAGRNSRGSDICSYKRLPRGRQQGNDRHRPHERPRLFHFLLCHHRFVLSLNLHFVFFNGIDSGGAFHL